MESKTPDERRGPEADKKGRYSRPLRLFTKAELDFAFEMIEPKNKNKNTEDERKEKDGSEE